MNAFLTFLSNLFKSKPADKNFTADVTKLFPDAIVAENLLPDSGVNITVAVLPGVAAGFPSQIDPFVSAGDGVLTIVVTGSAANDIAKALGLESFVPDTVKTYMVGLLTASGVVAKLKELASGGKGALVVAALQIAAPYIVSVLEVKLGASNGCITVR